MTRATDRSPQAPGPGCSPAGSKLVSVVIPAYDAAATIDETLRSVRAQTHGNLDIIVVDDGSKDDTPTIVERHLAEDSRIRLLHQPNGGVAHARNAGLRESAGDFVAFIDADDLWAVAKVEKQLDALERGGERCAVAYCWYALIDLSGDIISARHCPVESGDVLERMASGNLVGNGSSILARRSALLDVGGFETDLRERKAQGCEDYLLYFRLSERYEFVVVPEFLTGYRQSPSNMSSDLRQMFRSYTIVTDEIVERHPRFRDSVMMGRAQYLDLLLTRSFEQRQLRDAMYFANRLFMQPALGASLFAARFRTAAVNRLRRLAGRRVYTPLSGRFEIGDPTAGRTC